MRKLLWQESGGRLHLSEDEIVMPFSLQSQVYELDAPVALVQGPPLLYIESI
jgi:hypothetical protein